MAGVRSALIVASYEYQDPGLTRLRAPAQDAEALAAVLGDPDVGAFEIQTVLNAPAHTITRAMEHFFADRGVDDLLLLHYSGHGVKDESGDLYFAAANTELEYLSATGVSADFVNRLMNRTRARRVVLLLDCCYAGAFERGLASRGDGRMHLEERLSGRGRAVITASTSMEYAFEGTDLDDSQEGSPSVFTSALVAGLSSGDADQDQDGMIGLDELYEYVYDAVRQVTPNQTPSKWSLGIQGELYVARRSKPVSTPATLPEDLQEAMTSSFPSVRSSAVSELARLLRGRHAGLSLAARRGLEQLAGDDSRSVAAAASATLATFPTQRAPELPDEFAATDAPSRPVDELATTLATTTADQPVIDREQKPSEGPPEPEKPSDKQEPQEPSDKQEPQERSDKQEPQKPTGESEPQERRTLVPSPPRPRTSTEDERTTDPGRRRVQLSRRTVIIAVAVALVVVAAGIVYAVARDSSSSSSGSDPGALPVESPLPNEQAVVTVGNPAGGAIWVVDVGTGDKRELVDSEASRPTVTPDRTAVVYLKSVGGRDREARIINVDGSDDQPLFSDPDDPKCTRSTRPAWSPDGTQLAVICTNGDPAVLYTASADGSELTTVFTPNRGSLAASPTWAIYDDGTVTTPVIIYSHQDTDDSVDLWGIDPSDGLQRQQISGVHGADYDPDWSAEGGLVFQRSTEKKVGGAGSAYRRNPITDTATPLSLPMQAGPAVWSPEGDQLAYTTSDGGLAVADPDGSNFSLIPGITEVSTPAWGTR